MQGVTAILLQQEVWLVVLAVVCPARTLYLLAAIAAVAARLYLSQSPTPLSEPQALGVLFVFIAVAGIIQTLLCRRRKAQPAGKLVLPPPPPTATATATAQPAIATATPSMAAAPAPAAAAPAPEPAPAAKQAPQNDHRATNGSAATAVAAAGGAGGGAGAGATGGAATADPSAGAAKATGPVTVPLSELPMTYDKRSDEVGFENTWEYLSGTSWNVRGKTYIRDRIKVLQHLAPRLAHHCSDRLLPLTSHTRAACCCHVIICSSQKASAENVFQCVHVDMIRHDSLVDEWAKHPQNYVQKAIARGDTRFFYVVCFQVRPAAVYTSPPRTASCG